MSVRILDPSTELVLVRLSRALMLFTLCLIGATACGATYLALTGLMEHASILDGIALISNPSTGAPFWLIVLAGAAWAWGWSLARLWNKRLIVSGVLATAITAIGVVAMTPLGLGAVILGSFAVVTTVCIQFGRSDWPILRKR